jgi:two-component system OmpR family response regulator
MRILVIENEVELAHALEHDLQAEGFAVDVCHDGYEGLLLALTSSYDAIVLDLLMTGTDGFRVCTELRRLQVRTPILGLYANNDAVDEAGVFDVGADDCLSKPCSSLVLVTRLRALLRRGAQERPILLCVGDLILDFARQSCRRGEIEILLTPREFSLLEFLARHAGQVVSKREILDCVLEFGFDSNPSIVDEYIACLRGKIDGPFDRQSIQTTPGEGYRLLQHSG